MIVRFVRDSIQRSPRRKALIIAAIALGTSVATAMLGVVLSIGDKINVELRAAGANIVVTSRAASLTGGVGGITTAVSGVANDIQENLVPKIKYIFWGLNITGFAPSLTTHDGATVVQGVWFSHPYKSPDGTIQLTGMQAVNPVWQIEKGKWAQDFHSEDSPAECVIGTGIARRTGWSTDTLIPVLGAQCKVTGILSSGDEADDRILVPLALIQGLVHKPGVVDRIDVAALTKPEDDFARKDPRTMTAAELERWNCTNYVTSIAHQIEEAIPGTEARPVRRIADSEGKVLNSISGLMALIAFAALLSAGLTVWSLTATTMMERRGEIAIMQAIGGGRWVVAMLLGSEIVLLGLAGGAIGALAGVWLARSVGQSVFHDAIGISWIVPILIMLAAVLVALAGAAQPLRRALHLEPAVILREGI
jgi:putative ABC transport system permease protein